MQVMRRSEKLNLIVRILSEKSVMDSTNSIVIGNVGEKWVNVFLSHIGGLSIVIYWLTNYL